MLNYEQIIYIVWNNNKNVFNLIRVSKIVIRIK